MLLKPKSVCVCVCGGGTLVSNGVKVADKGKMWKIMKIAKNGLILLLDIGLEVLCPDMAHIY